MKITTYNRPVGEVKPVVVIATHARFDITKNNMETLLGQSVVPQIVLVCSDTEECIKFIDTFPNIHLVKTDNFPLGAKWQKGVDLAMELGSNPLIITGSDDILGFDFVKISCQLIQKYDFIGLDSWLIYENSVLRRLKYKTMTIPIGTRIYSGYGLKKTDIKVFGEGLNRKLDDKGYLRSSGLRKTVVDAEKTGLNVVSIKGNWAMMNPADKLLSSPNIQVVSTHVENSERALNQIIYGENSKI